MKKSILFSAFLLLVCTAVAQKQESVDLKKSMAAGLEIYSINCQSCHMENGEGVEDTFPPLASSDYMMADKNRLIRLILNGASEPMKVNGKTYESFMPGYPLSDQETADLLNYVRNSFGNTGGVTTVAEVAAARKN